MEKVKNSEISRGWPEEFVQILRQYPEKSLEEIAELTGKSANAVRKKLTRIGMYVPKKEPSVPPFNGIPWTEEETKYLSENYPERSVEELCEHLGRNSSSVRNKLSRMGLYQRVRPGRKFWTKEEKEFLEANYLRGYKYLATKLGRSKSSVTHQCWRMMLFIRDGQYMTMRDLADIFHSDPSVVKRWVRQGLPCRIIKNRLNSGKVIQRRLFEVESFWNWAKTHQNDVNWNLYEFGSLPPEPSWVKYAKFECKIPVRQKQAFTLSEIKRVKELREKGFSIREIAETQGRSVDSIKHALKTQKRLNCEGTNG